ncbi:helix-turn-helix transcriptional regulator, partial [Shewanella insulae]
DYFIPHTFHVMFIMLAKNIFNLSTAQCNSIKSGFTHSFMPDQNNFEQLTMSLVRNNESQVYIKIPNSILELKNQHCNPFLTDYFKSQYNQTYGIEREPDRLISDISFHLSSAWSQGITINIDLIANKLAMSRSKLYRELMARDITFSQIVESRRKEFAMMHIKDRSLSIADISDRLGYANVSAFTRAFNRWFDVNPSQMR